MNDEFPTLEAVAGLALVAALVRAWLVAAQARELTRRSDEIARALRAGDRSRARDIAAKSEAAALSHVAHSLIDALDAGVCDPTELARTLDHAERRVARRSLRASASGGITGLLLFGLLLFAIVSRVSAGSQGTTPWFEILVVAGLLALTAGIALNQRLATLARRGGERMLAAATEHAKEPAS